MSLEYVPIRFNDEYLKFRDQSNQKNTVVVAVMDTGVDPGAYGLTKCPDGTAKVIDVIDCTGSDDVIVKEIVQTSITDSKINEIMKNYNINENSKIYYGERDFKSFVSNRSYKTFEKKQQNVIDTLIFKIYVFESTNKYILILDYDGEQDHFIILDEYHFNQKFGGIPLGDGLVYNFGFHIYDFDKNTSDKKIVSLVFDTGSHATHVSGIIGGYFEDDTSKNGINPHVKILSLKIGDSRVDGMETTISFIRALKEIVRYDCHLANYSYGESVGKIDGKLIDILNEYVLKYNIMFCTSAGNSGPSFTTIGAPSVCTNNVLSIGAYTDDTILKNVYYLTDNDYDKGTYQWSSRGPALDNSMGVDVIAPGCAITSHPAWYKSDMRLCNGTSMASPNTAGFVSLILSQFNNTKSYPESYWIKKYIESTCKYIEKKDNYRRLETFTQGHGLVGYRYINIDEYFNTQKDYYYQINVDQNMNQGIIMMEKMNHDNDNDEKNIITKTFIVKIDPKIFNQNNANKLLSFKKKLYFILHNR
jgi:tripeptidyl-peptidase-2